MYTANALPPVGRGRGEVGLLVAGVRRMSRTSAFDRGSFGLLPPTSSLCPLRWLARSRFKIEPQLKSYSDDSDDSLGRILDLGWDELLPTIPRDEGMVTKRERVHPHTSFDHKASGLNTLASSDMEADLSDIKRARKMCINLSPIDASVPALWCGRQEGVH
jgi:hypothetical protein